MYYIANPISFLLIASTALVTAQDAVVGQNLAASSNSGSCTSQSIVDNCVTVMKGSLAKCTDNDWDCKCSGSANVANCYVDCPEDPARFSAMLVSEQDCATANAYDKGETSVASTWTTPGPNTVTATPTDTAVSTTTNTAEPTKSLQEEKDASPSKGAAVMKSAGSWLALLGLGVGVMI